MVTGVYERGVSFSSDEILSDPWAGINVIPKGIATRRAVI
jgi:hypothetical protein